MRSKNLQSGNVLFLILIAVALFAALSYAVTSSNRSSGSSKLTEKDKLAASAILNYTVSARTAVMRMVMSGVPVEQISDKANGRYSVDGSASNYTNNNLCLTDTCRVFAPSGGGVSYQRFRKEAMDAPSGWAGNNLGTGETDIVVINVENVGSSKNDIALRFVLLKNEICNAINVLNNKTTIYDWAVQSGSTLGSVATDLDNSAVYTFSGDAAGKFVIPVGGSEGCYLYAVIYPR